MSAANLSEHRRWALLCAFNSTSNPPYKIHHHVCTEFEIKDDSCIKKCGVRPISDGSVFMNPKTDNTSQVSEK